MTGGPRYVLDIFRRYFEISVAVQVQYQASTFIWLIGSVLEPLIYLVVWTTVARHQGGAVDGVGPRAFAAYYVALMLVNHWTFTWIMWEYEYLIRDGTLARRLMRPIHPVVGDLADNIAYKTLASAAMIPAAILMIVFFRPSFDLSAAQAAAFVPAFLLAFTLRFSMEWGFALAAFWTTRITALNQIYFMLMLFLSGRMAPLELMPGFLQALATALPFRWMLSFPLEVLLGRTTGLQIVQGYGLQLAWIAASVAAARLLWRAGVRQFSAVGG